MDDSSIIRLLFQRAEAAITALSEKFGPRLKRLALNILGSFRDAEECVSDTYLAIWNAIPPRQPDPLAGFVYKTGRNQALKRLRSDTAQKRCDRYDLSLDELAGCIPGPALEETVLAMELGLAIDSFLEGQSRENRILFLRRYWFGDSVRDISRDFGMKETAVSVRLSRIRGKLRTYLIEEGYVDA